MPSAFCAFGVDDDAHELVDRLGVGVDDGANSDAPSSLSGLPAGETPELEMA